MLDIGSVLNGNMEQLSLECSVDLSDISIYGEHLFCAPVLLKLSLFNRASVCTLNVEYKYSLGLTCSRCLCKAKKDFVFTARHTVVKSTTSERDDIVEAPGGMLDETIMCTDDLLAQLPMRYLCSEDCKGLCMHCGANLNVESCSCGD